MNLIMSQRIVNGNWKLQLITEYCFVNSDTKHYQAKYKQHNKTYTHQATPRFICGTGNKRYQNQRYMILVESDIRTNVI